MSINKLIGRNLKKNLRHYYLYVFALVFSAALYFSFVTLQYDPSMDAAEGSIKGAAATRTASILLVAIVTIFLLYANSIFIKRRSKEIGLLQLIGMTKGQIIRLLSVENMILYFGSLLAGLLAGFAFSRLVIMVLYKITGVQAIASLSFSPQALWQTVLVFVFIYAAIVAMNTLFIKRQTILSLFRTSGTAEEKNQRITKLDAAIGLLGIGLIAAGYIVSSRLFGGDFMSMNALFGAMAFILASVIIGTYLFYKGSVRFLFHLIRKRKGGYLTVNDALSLSSIMFRMKSNALMLTIITTVSALAIGLLSLTYISYYSAEKAAEQSVPQDFAFFTPQDAALFKQSLDQHAIAYEEKQIETIQVEVNVASIMESKMEDVTFDADKMLMPAMSDRDAPGFDVHPEDTVFSGYSDALSRFMPLKESGEIELLGLTEVIPQHYIGLERDFLLPYFFSSGGLPVAVVDDSVFRRLKQDIDPAIQRETSLYIGLQIRNEDELHQANQLFLEQSFGSTIAPLSQLEMAVNQKQNMGLIMFIVGFLGLTFLITSGCILYFKQMDESEQEKGSYTILRKLGYTQGDLLKGLQFKQLFNFGIPLTIGLLHSYFAVQSGWFFFGAELWMPMLIVMILYTALYSIFGLLSVFYCKKVIQDAL
ncbi:FtsX-like permease family protein [Domibacillus enclensis]|uniref:Bacitracin ABC transporter permease n=1 Tax=Domibacillus enclensis TaxID=1017273 RepID=A0A1N6Z2B2_9BACI|nr:ABC transporter permease [Domibacillus enclensis]OXS76568.1 bacitracin ABC transporter permease [Domibacillus enclensis]SIR20984.1 bacitracin transport system permease protein [Domibacillus enclensis]